MREEIECVETEDRKLVRNYFDVEPSPSLKAMPLLLGNKLAPDVSVRLEPPVRSRQEDVMREDIIVAERGHNWN